MKRFRISAFSVCACLCLLSCPPSPRDLEAGISYAGLRASGYGIRPFPGVDEWKDYASRMESWFPGSDGTFVWIVGTAVGPDAVRCSVNFPLDRAVRGVIDSPSDRNEAFLDMCDREGYAVWLQVEPGECDVEALAGATMRRYAMHPSVRGFGVDVEWYRHLGSRGRGAKVDDSTAERWDSAVKTVASRLSLFLKHWEPAWMPPTYRSDIVFCDDGQGHGSVEKLERKVALWAERFAGNRVWFQIGYESDRALWGDLNMPPRELGERVARALPSSARAGVIWVDFTLRGAMSSSEAL